MVVNCFCWKITKLYLVRREAFSIQCKLVNISAIRDWIQKWLIMCAAVAHPQRVHGGHQTHKDCLAVSCWVVVCTQHFWQQRQQTWAQFGDYMCTKGQSTMCHICCSLLQLLVRTPALCFVVIFFLQMYKGM